MRVTSAARASGAAELEALEDAGVETGPALARATEIEHEALRAGDVALQHRARLLQGDMLGRQGDTAAAAKIFWDIAAWARTHDDRPMLARTHRLLARTHYTLGDLAACLEHAVRAVELLDDDTPAAVRAGYLMVLASALNATGSYAAARERYLQAEQCALAGGDTVRLLAVLNNFAHSELVAGRPAAAWEVVGRWHAAAGGRPPSSSVLDTMARALVALGRYAEAEETAQRALDALHSSADVEADAAADAQLTLAAAQRHRGDLRRAAATLERCAALCQEQGLVELSVRLLLEQAELAAADGDFATAYTTYRAYHTAETNLISRQREAQARTRQAMYEATEARREALRFREEARHDPLTGLPNRRYVDELLPGLLGTGRTVLAAIVDLDHFKQINDRCSHAVGDQVLVAVARLLADAAGTGGFAARLGGEEFLVVLTGIGVAEGVEQLERLRCRIAGQPWHPLTGDLPVTVSMGVAAAPPHPDQRDLLAHADAHLYAAKRAGRNRISIDR